MISKVDSSGTSWPSSLTVNLDPVGMASGGAHRGRERLPSSLRPFTGSMLCLSFHIDCPEVDASSSYHKHVQLQDYAVPAPFDFNDHQSTCPAMSN